MKTEVFSTDAQEFKFARGFQLPDDTQLEDAKLDIVKWGKTNLFPNFLNNILYSSAYQSGIIRGKVNYIVGSGYQETGIDNVSFGDFDFQDVLDAAAFDLEMYDAMSIRVKRNLEGEKSYEHIDFDMLRLDKHGRGWWYSDDWSQSKQSEENTGLKLYPNYDPKKPDLFDSIYVAYANRPKNKQTRTSKKDQVHEYPQPSYIGALKSLMTDIEIQSFHLYNIINGMKVSGALNFSNGAPENKTQFEQAVKDAITPSENSGGILITYSDGEDRKVAWVPFTGDDLDKRYLILEKSVVQNIFTAHGVTSSMLFGIKTEGQLGGSTELQDAFNIFVRTYVRNRQKFLEQHFNYLFDGVTTVELNEPHPIVEQRVEPHPQVMKAEKDEAEDKILLSLMKCGRPKGQFKILKRNDVNDEFDFESEEKGIKESFFKGEFAISNIESRVLDLIRKGESLDAIVDALDDSPNVVKKAYADMTAKGLIKDGDITNDGVRELAQNQPDFETEILYSYELRPDAPPLKTESREFCQILTDLNRLYTRQEIEQISAEVDRNVWRYRGGWYNDPTKDRPTPFCRHVWSQNLTIKRN